MSWVRIDDQFPDHPKAIAIGLEGQGLQLAAICYCSRQLTDGFLPAAVLPRLTGMGEKASQVWGRRMVAACLWEAVPGGFRIHDYLEYQPTREWILQKRAAESARKRGGIRPTLNDPTPTPLPTSSHVHPTPSPNARARGGGTSRRFIQNA